MVQIDVYNVVKLDLWAIKEAIKKFCRNLWLVWHHVVWMFPHFNGIRNKGIYLELTFWPKKKKKENLRDNPCWNRNFEMIENHFSTKTIAMHPSENFFNSPNRSFESFQTRGAHCLYRIQFIGIHG